MLDLVGPCEARPFFGLAIAPGLVERFVEDVVLVAVTMGASLHPKPMFKTKSAEFICTSG